MGINMPEMGMITPKRAKRAAARSRIRATTAASSIADALFSTTLQRVLGLLFGQPTRSFFANELIGLTGSGSGAVQRELARLVESGLIKSHEVGRQRHYQANVDAPIYNELRAIVVKTSGVAEPLRAALSPLADRIVLAMVYGSVAKGAATSSSDIDLLIVSDRLTLEDVYAVLAPAEKQLARKISPTLYSIAEFTQRRKKKNPFLMRVLAGAQIPLIGDKGVAASR
jgi:predicted nucleotidyltransferase